MEQTQKTQLITTVVKFGLFLGIIGFAYYKIANIFTKMKSDSRYRPSNINASEAKNRADALYTAMYGFGANFETVSQNLTGLNHNAYIEVYNAFGKKRAANFKDLNLTEWITDQFSGDDLSKLRFIINGFF
jgi:hypothetical protein